jgi:hypothetical protein
MILLLKLYLLSNFRQDIISADPLFGEQLVVSEEEVTVKNEGFEHRKVSIDFKKSVL